MSIATTANAAQSKPIPISASNGYVSLACAAVLWAGPYIYKDGVCPELSMFTDALVYRVLILENGSITLPERTSSGSWETPRRPQTRVGVMTLELLLRAAEYLERRERGMVHELPSQQP